MSHQKQRRRRGQPMYRCTPRIRDAALQYSNQSVRKDRRTTVRAVFVERRTYSFSLQYLFDIGSIRTRRYRPVEPGSDTHSIRKRRRRVHVVTCWAMREIYPNKSLLRLTGTNGLPSYPGDEVSQREHANLDFAPYFRPHKALEMVVKHVRDLALTRL